MKERADKPEQLLTVAESLAIFDEAIQRARASWVAGRMEPPLQPVPAKSRETVS